MKKQNTKNTTGRGATGRMSANIYRLSDDRMSANIYRLSEALNLLQSVLYQNPNKEFVDAALAHVKESAKFLTEEV